MSFPDSSSPMLPDQIAFVAPLIHPLRELHWSHGIRGQCNEDGPLPDLTNVVTKLTGYPVAGGGYGNIYEATLNMYNPWETGPSPLKVAVKALRPPPDDDSMQKGKKKIRRELHVWKKLKHENILPLCGLFQDKARVGPFPAMVCPWADRGNLHEYLRSPEGLCLTTLEKFRIVRHSYYSQRTEDIHRGQLSDVAAGLLYLHSREVVHGDLTSPNVLIDSSGRACLADFGLSTVLAEFGNSYFSSVRQGALRWVAPELLMELQDGNPVQPTVQGDVYSFGGIMLQVLSGKEPYHHIKNPLKLLMEIHERGKPERRPDHAVSEAHWNFMERCWSKPFHRPTMQEVCQFIDLQIELYTERTTIFLPIPTMNLLCGFEPLRRQVRNTQEPVHPDFKTAVSSCLPWESTQIALDLILFDLCSEFHNLVNTVLTSDILDIAQQNAMFMHLAEDLHLADEAFAMLKYDSGQSRRISGYAERLRCLLQSANFNGSASRFRVFLSMHLQDLLGALLKVMDDEFHAVREAISPVYRSRYQYYSESFEIVEDVLVAANKPPKPPAPPPFAPLLTYCALPPVSEEFIIPPPPPLQCSDLPDSFWRRQTEKEPSKSISSSQQSNVSAVSSPRADHALLPPFPSNTGSLVDDLVNLPSISPSTAIPNWLSQHSQTLAGTQILRPGVTFEL